MALPHNVMPWCALCNLGFLGHTHIFIITVKPVSSDPLSKRPKMGFQDQLSLNEGQKYCRMHSAILSTCIELPHGFKTFVLSIFEWPLKTGYTVVTSFLLSWCSCGLVTNCISDGGGRLLSRSD